MRFITVQRHASSSVRGWKKVHKGCRPVIKTFFTEIFQENLFRIFFFCFKFDELLNRAL